MVYKGLEYKGGGGLPVVTNKGTIRESEPGEYRPVLKMFKRNNLSWLPINPWVWRYDQIIDKSRD
jgi:hypothetical protein